MPPKPTAVYDSYWKFAALRQEVYFRRLMGEPPPWTEDPVLLRHRFTNAYRASDRVSQYLIADVSGMSLTWEEAFLRTILFKVFNKIETWNLIEVTAGPIGVDTFDVDRIEVVLDRAMAEKTRIYSAAYIMPMATAYGGKRKHGSHLRMLAQMMKDDLPAKIADARTMEAAYQLLLGYSGIGPFLAFQYLIDLNYNGGLQFDEMEFVVAGPGCLSGLRKCFSDPGGYSDADLIRYVCDRQEAEFERLGLEFRDLFGRRLHLIDCQNLFCETDKYARVMHPEATGSGRTRIKQSYKQDKHKLRVPDPWFPPKWGINETVQTALRGRPGAVEPLDILDLFGV